MPKGITQPTIKVLKVNLSAVYLFRMHLYKPRCCRGLTVEGERPRAGPLFLALAPGNKSET